MFLKELEIKSISGQNDNGQNLPSFTKTKTPWGCILDHGHIRGVQEGEGKVLEISKEGDVRVDLHFRDDAIYSVVVTTRIILFHFGPSTFDMNST